MAEAAAQSDIEDVIDTTYDPQAFTQPDIDDTETLKLSGIDYTEAQSQALRHKEGPGLVIAGPGAGKTAVLRGRVEHLVKNEGVKLYNILSLAYNRAAKEELISRLKHLGTPHVQTLHGFAYRVVRENLAEAGFEYTPRTPNTKKGEDLESFISDMLQYQNKGRAVDARYVKEIAGEIDVFRAGITEGRFSPDMLEGEARVMATAYEDFKRDNKIVDFHDQLEIAGEILGNYPAIRERYQRQYPFLQVDEFQDVAPADRRMLQQLTRNLFAVGDDDQSIYGFRGADSTVMHEFAEGAKQYEVTANFRSRPEIVDTANKIVEGSKKRIAKELTSTRDPGGSVRYVETDPMNVFDKLRAEIKEGQETAILVATRHEKRLMENYLLQIPELMQDVTVSTMHSAKGLEWDKVIVLLNTLERSGGLYRSFPTANTPEELEEERRVFYVATTRAKEELVYMGREEKFLPELGFESSSAQRAAPPPETVAEAVKDMEVESKGIADRFGNLFHKFRAHYQRVRTYQDMVDMEKDLPIMNIVENIDLAQLHRSKIEDLGKQLNLQPADRSDRPAKMRLVDRALANLHKPGRVFGTSMAGVLGAGELMPPRNPFMSLGLYGIPYMLTKGFRKFDEVMYPHARRPESQLNYRQLFMELPERVRANLPDEVIESALDASGQLRNWRYIQSRAEGTYQPVFYEFPDPVEGWEGDSKDRPMFDTWGRQMNRITHDDLKGLDEQGLRSAVDTDLDTSDPSKNLKIRPYSEFGYEDIYREPVEPREPRELSDAVKEFIGALRGHVEQNRAGARSPRWRDDWYFRWKWGRNHRKALKRIDKFLLANMHSDIVNFKDASRVLDQMHRARSPISMGAESGVHDIGGAVTAMHNEILDHLEKVWNERSPYFSPSHWVMAGGKFHKLPDGTLADVEQDPVTYTPTGTRQKVADLLSGKTFGDGRARKPRGLEKYGLMIETLDEFGEIQTGSGVYLGDGRVGTAMHTFRTEHGRTPTKAVARSLRGGADIDVTGFVNYDPELDLAIIQLDEQSKHLKKLRAVRARGGQRRGRNVETMGVAKVGNQFLNPFGTRARISETSDNIGLLGGADTNFYPLQSGSGVFSRRMFGLLPPRLQGIFTGGIAPTDDGGFRGGFYTPVEQLDRLMSEGELTPFSEGIGDVAAFTEKDLLTITRTRLEGLEEELKDPTRPFASLRGSRQGRMRTALLTQRGRIASDIARLEEIITATTTTEDDLLGFNQLTGQRTDTELARYAHRTETGEPVGAALEQLEKAQEGIDRQLSILDDPLNTRSADFGRSVGRTRFAGAAGRGADIAGAGVEKINQAFTRMSEMSEAFRALSGVQKAAKATKVFGVALEGLDVLDKVQFWGGGADKAITGSAIESGDNTRMLERYIALLQQGQLRDQGRGAIFQDWFTPYERQYLEEEGGLKPLLDTEIGGGKPFRWLGQQPGFKQLGGMKSVQLIGETAHRAVQAIDIIEKVYPRRLHDLIGDRRGYDIRREHAESIAAAGSAIDISQLTPEQQKEFARTMQYEQDVVGKDLREVGHRIQKAKVYGEDMTWRSALGVGVATKPHMKWLAKWLIEGDPARLENLEEHKKTLQARGTVLEHDLMRAQALRVELPTPQHLRKPRAVAPQDIPDNIVRLEPITVSAKRIADPQAQVLGGNMTTAATGVAETASALSEYQRGQLGTTPIGQGLHFAQPTEGQPYLLIEGPDAVIDGDTIKGIIHAFGQQREVSVRIPSIDTAELKPKKFDRFGQPTGRTDESIAVEKEIAERQKQYFRNVIANAIAESKRLNIGTERGQIFLPGSEEALAVGGEIGDKTLRERMAKYTWEQAFAIPLDPRYAGEVDDFDRVLAELQFTHTSTGGKFLYGDLAKTAGQAAAYKHGFSWGAPMPENLDDFSEQEREGARKYFDKLRERTPLSDTELRIESLSTEIADFKRDYKYKTDSMYGTYTAGDLEGYITDLAGTADAPGRIIELRQSIADKEQLIAHNQKLLAESIPDPEDINLLLSPLYQKKVQAHEEAIKETEKELKEEQEALTALMTILRDSSSKLNQLRTSVHKARMSQLQEERAFELQKGKEEYNTLAEVINEQGEVRKLLPESMLGDTDFMGKFESNFRERMIGEKSETQTSLESLSRRMEAKDTELQAAAKTKEDAYQAFVAAPGTETEAAYTQAKQDYAVTFAEYSHLERQKQLEQKTLEAVEGALDSSQRAAAVAQSVADKLEANALRDTLAEDTDAYAKLKYGLAELHDSTISRRVFELRNDPLAFKEEGLQRFRTDAGDWADASIDDLTQQRLGFEARLSTLRPELTTEQGELASLRERHAGLLAEGISPEGEVLDKDKLAEAALVQQQIDAKEKHVKIIEETVKAYEQHIERIKQGIQDIAEELAKYMHLSADAAAKAVDQRMKEETATKRHLLGKDWADYTEDDKQKYNELMRTPQAFWDEEDYAFRDSFIDKRKKEHAENLKEQEREFFRTGTPEEIWEWHKKQEAGETDDPIARKNAIIREGKRIEQLIEQEQKMRIKMKAEDRRRIVGGVSNLVGDIPGNMYEAFWAEPRRIDERHDERKADLEEHLDDRIADIRSNPMLSKRQQMKYIEDLEERHQKKLQELDEETNEKKKDSYNSVVKNFKEGLGKMLIEETQLRLARSVSKGIFKALGWDEGGSGEFAALRAVGSKSGVSLGDVVRKTLFGGEETGGGGLPAGTQGAGGSNTQGGFSFGNLFGGNAPSAPTGDNWLARALPKKQESKGMFSGLGNWWDGVKGNMSANMEMSKVSNIQQLASHASNLYQHSDDSRERGLGSFGARMLSVASPQGFLKEAAFMGAEALATVADGLTATSGTGNWFTQSGKDIWGFLGDTFSFDNALNDRMARKVGAKQQIQRARKQAERMGHSSAMDILSEHAKGFSEEVDALHRRQGVSMGVAGDKELVANITIVQEDGGRQRVKKDERQRAKLSRQGVLPTVERR